MKTASTFHDPEVRRPSDAWVVPMGFPNESYTKVPAGYGIPGSILEADKWGVITNAPVENCSTATGSVLLSLVDVSCRVVEPPYSRIRIEFSGSTPTDLRKVLML